MRIWYPVPTFAEVSYTFFTEQTRGGNVEEVISQSDVIRGTFKKAVGYPPERQETPEIIRFSTVRPAFATSNLEQLLEDHKVIINARALDDGQPDWWETLLFGFGPALLLVGAFVWLSRKASRAGAGGLFGLGQSRAKRYAAGTEQVTFDDVAGIEDAEHELVEVVDFLKDPAKYQRLGQDAVQQADFADALEKIRRGPARHVLLDPVERERTAYHESGHALVGLLVPGSDPVQGVTIIPRGLSLGATYQLPTDDRTNYSESYLRGRIVCALGGRAAEELVYGSVTTGAESDLQQVSEIARWLVVRWGMSDKVGPMSLTTPQEEGMPPSFQRPSYSEATSELIDQEVRTIVQTSYGEAERLLAAHREQLDALAGALLASESLDRHEILAVIALPSTGSSKVLAS